ncbi:hypothetical protein EV122DRAFT_280443 [Schizophyllum commune]
MSLQIHDVSADVVRDVGRSVPHLPVALAFWHRTSNHRSAEKDERVLCGQLRLGQSLCKFLLETANHFKWPLVLSHHMHRINATILDIFTIDYIVLYCIYKQTCEPGPKFEMALKHQASKVYVWAETLYTEDTKAYDDMFAAIFGALAGKHIQYLLEKNNIPWTPPAHPPLPPFVSKSRVLEAAQSNGEGPSTRPSTTKRTRADETEDDAARAGSEDAGAGTLLKRHKSTGGASSSLVGSDIALDTDDIFRQFDPAAIDVDIAEAARLARAEVPETHAILNAFMAIPDLMKNGPAKFGEIMKKYVLPHATKGRVIAAVILCLGVVLVQTQPEWVRMLLEARHVIMSPQGVWNSGLTPAQDQCILRCLRDNAAEAKLDVDTVQRLIGTIKCESSAKAAFKYFMIKGKLPNSEWYYGIGKAALCGAFKAEKIKIVKTLPRA